MNYMTERLGAWQVGDDPKKGKVEFKIFLPKNPDPRIASIRVAGDFQKQLTGGKNWDYGTGIELQSIDTGEGTIWSGDTLKELKADFYQYSYQVTFQDGQVVPDIGDPCARYGGTDRHKAGIVVGGSRAADNVVPPLLNGKKPLRDLIIYELMIDDFTLEYRGGTAPLAAVIGKLDNIKEVGFNAILFMPWTAWHNRDFDWGYAPFQYFAVEYRYANNLKYPSEKISWLKQLIRECHLRDIHVIMDGVFNHVSMDFPYKLFYQNANDCPYTGSYGGYFAGLQDLDFNHECTNEFIRDVCLYWMDTFGIDGIRLDNTVNYYVPGDPNGLTRLIHDIQTYLEDKGEKNFSLTLEHIALDAIAVTKQVNATSYWDNAFYERTFDYLWSGQIDSRLLNALTNARFLDSTDRVPTIYCSNHDHSQVAWRAGARANSGSMRWYKIQPYVIALYTSPATPLIPNGQEFGEDHWIPEDDQGTGRRVKSRPLRWKQVNDPVGQRLSDLHKCLGKIRQEYTGLRSANFYPQPWEEWQTLFNQQGYGVDVYRQLVIYHRWGADEQGNLQRFIIVLNFADEDQDVCIPFSDNGTWTDLLSGFNGSWKPEISNYQLCFRAGSNWGHVFFK